MDYSNIKVPRNLHKKLLELQAVLQKQEGRRVTLIEVIEKLIRKAK